MKNSTLHKFSSFFPYFNKGELLNFNLGETPLFETSKSFSDYLGVKKCFLKLETQLPTGTMKDRITELMFSRFKKENVSLYAHASTGNTAASLAWGMKNYAHPFEAHLFIAESALPYHNFEKPSNLHTTLLEGATYDESVLYSALYTKNVIKDDRELGGATSTFRHSASKLSYLEALWQLYEKNIEVDMICQSISAGVGIIGADIAIKDALCVNKLHSNPMVVVGQPTNANPIVACYNNGAKEYDHRFTISKPKDSLAWPIRRGNAKATYGLVKNILDKTNGLALEACENEILRTNKMLLGSEGINIGYASTVVMAGLHNRKKIGDLRDKTCLIMVTGKDRSRHFVTKVDKVLKKEEWAKALY